MDYNIDDLVYEPDEEVAKRKAAALAQALRGQGDAAILANMAGVPMLQALGHGWEQQSRAGLQDLSGLQDRRLKYAMGQREKQKQESLNSDQALMFSRALAKRSMGRNLAPDEMMEVAIGEAPRAVLEENMKDLTKLGTAERALTSKEELAGKSIEAKKDMLEDTLRNRKEVADRKAAAAAAAAAAKADTKDDKEEETGALRLQKAWDNTKASSRSAFGLSGIKTAQIQRDYTLLAQGHNLTHQQQEELAIGVATALAPGHPAINTIKNLVPPETLASGARATYEWLVNKPQRREQQEFVKIMHDTLTRLEAENMRQDAKERLDILSGEGVWVRKHPEAAKRLIDRYGLTNMVGKDLMPLPLTNKSDPDSSGDKRVLVWGKNKNGQVVKAKVTEEQAKNYRRVKDGE